METPISISDKRIVIRHFYENPPGKQPKQAFRLPEYKEIALRKRARQTAALNAWSASSSPAGATDSQAVGSPPALEISN